MYGVKLISSSDSASVAFPWDSKLGRHVNMTQRAIQKPINFDCEMGLLMWML